MTETTMTEISDEFMLGMLSRSRSYTVVLLGKTPRLADPDAKAIIWEHGRRNFALRAQGLLCVVCPIADDSTWAGVGLFDASPEETARLMDDDPAIRAGVLTYEVHPVRGFPGDALAIPADGAAVPRRPDPLDGSAAGESAGNAPGDATVTATGI